MWSAIFGAEQALQQDGESNANDGYVGSPTGDDSTARRHSNSSGSPRALAPAGSPLKPLQVPVSPADTASSTPRSSVGDLSVSSYATPRSSFTKRPSLLGNPDDDDDDDDDDDSPMTMLLRRMNVLMVRAGEHEFEKKVLVDQMEKDRERMKRQVAALERTVQDLKDQNVQLQYKIEYTSEPMLMERLQDVTDMHDALKAVKEQLVEELDAKEKALQELKQQLAQKEETIELLQNELEQEKHERGQERADAAHSLAELTAKLKTVAQEAELAVQHQYTQQLEELHGQVSTTAQERDQAVYERDGLAASLSEKQHDLEAVQQDKIQEVMELAAELQQVQRANEQRVASLEQSHQLAMEEQFLAHEHKLAEWKQSSDQRLAEKEQQLKQLRSEWTEQGNVAETRLRERIVEVESQLENQSHESESRINEMNQVMEDYKHDCMELWKLNEDLKQQLALASADSMLKEAEFRQKEFSAQSRVSELESQLEELQESINRKEQELVMKEEELISIREEAAHQVAAAAKRREDEENQPWKENAIRLLTEQVASAQRELSQAMELNLQVTNRNTLLEEQNHQLIATTEAANQQAAEATKWQQRVCVLEGKVGEQHRALETSAATALELEQTVSAKSQELNAKLQEFAYEKQQLEQMLDGANHEVVAVQARVMEWEAAHAELSTRLTALQEEAVNTVPSTEFEQLTRKIEALRSQNGILQEEVAHARAESTQLEADAEIRVGKVSHELEVARSEIAAALEEIASLKASSAARASSLVEESSSNAEVEQLRSTIQAMEVELNALRASSQMLREKEREIVDLQLSLESLHDEMNALKAVSAEQQARTAPSAAQDEELEELRSANWELEEQVESLTTELTEANKRVQALTAQAEHQGSASSEVNILQADKEALQEELELAQATLADAETSLQDLETTMAEQSAVIVNLEQQIKNLQEASEDSLNELEAKLEQTMEELEHVQRELHSKSEHCEQLELSLQDAQASSSGETQSLHDDLAASRECNSKLTSELEYLKLSEQSLQGSAQELEQSNASLTEELEVVRAERRTIEQQLAQMQNEVQETNESVDKQLSAVRRELAESQASARELSDEAEQLKEQLEHERVKLQRAEEQVQGAEAELVRPLQQQVEALTVKKQSLIAELETVRDELEKKDEQTKAQVDKLRAALKETKQEHAKVSEAYEAKELEFSTMRDNNLTEIIKLRSSLDRLKDQKKQIVPEIKQLRVEVEELRAAQATATAERDSLLGEVDSHMKEVARLQTLLKKAQEAAERGDDEATAEQVRLLQQEKNQVVDEVRQLELVNHRLEETNQELEATLQKSKEFCEELSRRCEDKVNDVQDSMQQALEERAAETAHMAIMNGSLRHEIEQLAESRYEQERYIEELRLQLADLQAEKNVLAARSHRLTEELSQYTELPDDDALADAHSPAPDLWELLSSGMEQLKADLELASKYASSIEGGAVLDDFDGPESEEATMATASASRS